MSRQTGGRQMGNATYSKSQVKFICAARLRHEGIQSALQRDGGRNTKTRIYARRDVKHAKQSSHK